MLSRDPSEWKKWDTNSVPWSEVTWPGALCFKNMWVRNSWASWGVSTVSWVGMNSDCLVSLSTITRIAVNPSDMGSCSMKSIEIDSQGWLGIGSCLRRLQGLWRITLVRAQLVHDLM